MYIICMRFPEELYYTADHEWLLVKENGEVYVGITDFAQRELGDIVYVDIPSVGSNLNRNDVFGSVEAVKTVSDLFIPVSCKILEFNNILDDAALLNTDPYTNWIVRIEMNDKNDISLLLNVEDYKKSIGL